MIHLLLRRVPICALLLASTTLFAARGTLQADGIFKVKGADMVPATITVVSNGAAAYSFPAGTSNFTLNLPLNDTYLVNFERAGCPTKQLYFDARVPVEWHATDFRFPFLVTLQHVTPEHMFVYAGPVGFVRYQGHITDFGYETVYKIKIDEGLEERLEQMRATGVDPKIMLVPSAAFVIDRPRGGGEGIVRPAFPEEGTTAPNVREVPVLVHVVSTPQAVIAPAAPIPVVEQAAFAPKVPTPPRAENALVMHVPVQQHAAYLPVPTTVALIPTPLAEFTPVAPVLSVINGTHSIRTDELIVERNRVIRVVRYTQEDGSVMELRQITQAYGAVFYFNNTDSITQRAFAEMTAQQ